MRALTLALVVVMVAGAITLFVPAYRPVGGAMFVAACLGMLFLRRFRPELFEARERIDVDGWGVRRFEGPRQTEALAWSTLVRVSITTTADGAASEHCYIMLHSVDGSGVAVSSQLAAAPGLLASLQRLPGFDREAIARVKAAVEPADVACWEGAAGDGLIVARALEGEGR